MSYWGDIGAVLKGDFIALDDTEAAILGAPKGETVSLYAEMERRHGWLLARVACVIFSVLIQRGHCRNQLAGGKPMGEQNYIRAAICLVVLPPVLAVGVLLVLKGLWMAACLLLRGVR